MSDTSTKPTVTTPRLLEAMKNCGVTDISDIETHVRVIREWKRLMGKS